MAESRLCLRLGQAVARIFDLARELDPGILRLVEIQQRPGPLFFKFDAHGFDLAGDLPALAVRALVTLELFDRRLILLDLGIVAVDLRLDTAPRAGRNNPAASVDI